MAIASEFPKSGVDGFEGSVRLGRTMGNEPMTEEATLLKRLPNRLLLRIFSMGMSAPTYIVMPAMKMRVARSDQTICNAWASVGHHFSRAMKPTANGRRTKA